MLHINWAKKHREDHNESQHTDSLSRVTVSTFQVVL